MKARRGHRHEGGEGPHPPYAWRRIDRALFRTSAFPSVHLSAAIMPQLGVPGNRGAGESPDDDGLFDLVRLAHLQPPGCTMPRTRWTCNRSVAFVRRASIPIGRAER